MTMPVLYRPLSTPTLPDVVTLDSWSATATDSQGTEWWLTGLDGWHGTPDPRMSGIDRPQDHGGFDGPSYLNTRIVTIQGTAVATDRTAALLARDVISSLCWDMTSLYTMQVTEPGRPTRRASVRLNAGVKVSEVSDAAFDWQLQLKAPDPRRYDDTETAIVLSPPTGATGGLQIPFTIPFTISTSGTSTSSATAVNSGTVATRPIVTIAGPMVDPQIANITTGQSLSLTITLVDGDVLTLDFDRRTVMLNGSASRSNALTATAAWWELNPGGSDLVFTAGGGTGTATVRYRSAWL